MLYTQDYWLVKSGIPTSKGLVLSSVGDGVGVAVGDAPSPTLFASPTLELSSARVSPTLEKIEIPSPTLEFNAKPASPTLDIREALSPTLEDEITLFDIIMMGCDYADCQECDLNCSQNPNRKPDKDAFPCALGGNWVSETHCSVCVDAQECPRASTWEPKQWKEWAEAMKNV